MTDDPSGLHARIAEAQEHLALAEQKLADVMSRLEEGTRADKVIIGPTLKDAFDELAEARRDLEKALEDS